MLNSGGPLTGATAVVAIRDADTNDSYLDFSDNTFKTAGFTTRQAALLEGNVGVYTLSGGLDLSVITNLPAATDQLIAEYEVTAPAAATGIVMDLIELLDALPMRGQPFTFKYVYFSGATKLGAGLGALAGTVAIDGVAPVPVTGTISDIGGGWYQLAASAADMAGNVLGFTFTATGADDSDVEVLTR